MYTHNDWTNFGDVSPWHGQLWIRDAFVDSTDDFAEVIEIIGPGSFQGLADNQILIVRGSIYIPIDDKAKVANALDCIGKTHSLATWIDLALAFRAYHGIDPDIYCPQEVVQVGAIDTGEGLPADVVLHGNASIKSYLKKEVLL